MKRLTVASLSCFAAFAVSFASVRSATPVTPTPVVKNVTGGVVMTGQDTGAPLPSPSPAARKLPLTLSGTAVVMTGIDTGAAQASAAPSRAMPITLGAPPVVMTGQDAGPAVPALHYATAAPRQPLIVLPPSPSPAPTRGIKP